MSNESYLLLRREVRALGEFNLPFSPCQNCVKGMFLYQREINFIKASL
jgi:hypothetical protein